MKADWYLSIYNRFQIISWLVIPFLVLVHSSRACAWLKVAQFSMVLDVVHAFAKLTRTTPLAALLQIASRVYVVLLYYSECTFSWNFVLMCMCWSIAEVLRFVYYEFSALKWLRYSAFLVLYPVGVFLGELPLIFQHFRRTGFALDCAAFIVYVPGFPFLFIHMLRARSRALRGSEHKGAERSVQKPQNEPVHVKNE